MRASQEALDGASQTWSSTFDAMSDAVSLLDRDGTVVRCNDAMAAIVGREADAVVGKKCYELVHGTDTFYEGCPFQRMSRTRRHESFEMTRDRRWYQVTTDPLFDEAEEIIGAVHILRDITEPRTTREALARERENLALLNDIALKLASLPGSVALGGYLADRLRQVTGAVAATFNAFQPESSELVTSDIQVEPGSLSRFGEPLLRRLKGTRSPVDAATYSEIVSHLVGTRRTLTEISFGTVPSSVGAVAQKLLGVDRFVAIAYVVEGELYGTSMLALRSGQPDPSPSFLESFANMGAVSLRRRRAEQQLVQASAYNRRLIEASVDPFVTITPDGLISDANDALANVTGCTLDQLAGTDVTAYVTEPEKAKAGYERAFRDGSIRDYPLLLRHPDGHQTEVLCNASTYQDADGEVAGVFVTARDVGSLREAERQIQAANAELERRVDERTRELATANRELQELVYSVSHDLRTPLRAIDGFCHSVLQDHGDVLAERAHADLGRVRTAAQHMGELIDALLSLTRLGQSQVQCGEVDVSAVARSVRDDLLRRQPERDVHLSIQDGLIAETDAALVEVVVENLLDNALKFSCRQPATHIALSATTRDDRLVFAVADDGCGFDPAYADKLFSPFQRLHADDEYPGVGVGLATTARVLDRMGGTYWAEGRLGEGATFFFTLPGARTTDDSTPVAERR